MFRAASWVFQGLQFLWRRRVLQAFLWLIGATWAFDRLLFCITEAQWFASLGFGSLFWSRVWAQTQLFAGFLLVALLLSRLFLRPVTQISRGVSPLLRGRLAEFEPLRDRVARLAWGVVMVSALVLAHHFSRGWSEWLFLRAAPRVSPLIFGLPRALWTHFLPVFAPFLSALWSFAVLLWLVVAATGVLRALPLLAAREPAPPLALPRTLWRLGALVLGLRGLIYTVQLLDLSRGRALESGDVFVSMPLFGLGALSCVFFALLSWRRATARLRLQKFPRLGIGIAAALLLPATANWLSFPLRALLPDTRWIAAQKRHSTRTAWRLPQPGQPVSTPISPSTPVEAAWPVWNETFLLESQRGASFRGQRVVEWQSATLGFEKGHWRALVVGEGAGAKAPTARRDADETTQLAFQRLDISPQNGAISATPLVTAPAWFGLEGRTLFGNGDFGVPIGSVWAKWAWAWRLRDFLLPFEAANATRLLVWRGARERAAKLTPFWSAATEPQLVLEGQTPVWRLDLCALSAHFPGASGVSNGELAGANSASDTIMMRLDAHSGGVRFFAASGARNADFLLDSWRRALPQLIAALPGSAPSAPGASPAILRAQIEVETALQNQSGAVFGPQHGFETGRGPLSRVAVVENGGWRTLETTAKAPHERVWRRAKGDFEARVRALDEQLSRNAPPQAQEMRLGEPFVWPDKGAPGGWWIGRASFSAPRAPNLLRRTDEPKLKLWRIALTGAAPQTRVEVAGSARAVGVRFGLAGASAPPARPAGTPKRSTFETRALQLHRAAQTAARRGDWENFGRLSAYLQAILEQMAAREATNNR